MKQKGLNEPAMEEEILKADPDLPYKEVIKIIGDRVSRQPQGITEYQREMLAHARIQTELLVMIHLDTAKKSGSRPLSPSLKPNDELAQRVHDRYEVEEFKAKSAKWRFIQDEEDLKELYDRAMDANESYDKYGSTSPWEYDE